MLLLIFHIYQAVIMKPSIIKFTLILHFIQYVIYKYISLI